jgi:hypothetical protein
MPAQVTLTLFADGKSPDITSKPGEIGSSLPDSMTTGSSAETTYFKDYSRGIKESMGVSALYRNFLIPAGYCISTHLAANSINRMNIFLRLALFAGQTGPHRLFDPLSVIGPKTINAAICSLHCNNPQ